MPPPSDILAIYAAYPRHVGKAAAIKKIAKAISTIAADRDVGEASASAWLLAKVREYAAARAGQDRQFTPHPATWFHQGRYDDDPAEWIPSQPPLVRAPEVVNGKAGHWRNDYVSSSGVTHETITD